MTSSGSQPCSTTSRSGSRTSTPPGVLRHGAQHARDRADRSRPHVHRVGRLLARRGRVGSPGDQRAAHGLRRAHTRDVDEFWRAGIEAGYPDDGAPGWRPQYREDYYGSFLLDPDGNSVEAVHHGAMRGHGIDHLWIRVADVAAAKSFYEVVAPFAGFRPQGRHAEPRAVRRRERFVLARRRDADAAVSPRLPRRGRRDRQSRFTRCDCRGVPRQRRPRRAAEYHEGYYGAFVLDPDGHNVEVVNHNR